MGDTRKLAGSEKLFGFGHTERARDKADARRQIEGLNQQDQMITLMVSLVNEQRRTNELLTWFAERAHSQDQRSKIEQG